jgi:Domain of unknown function (DUF5011)
MKNQLTISIVLFLFMFFSCTKDNDLSMDFKITGVNNKTIVRGTGIVMPMEVFYLGGEKQKATVSAENVPSGIIVSFDNSTGEPDFSLTCYVSADVNMIPGNYSVTIKVVSEVQKQITKDFIITVTDPANKVPVLTLAGPASTTWVLNDPYLEPGYMAIDVEDGDLTSQVIVTGSVNYDKTGNYTINYKVFDSDGDSAVKNRTITVLNSNAYMQGLYNCTTAIQGGPTFTWQSFIETSSTNNFHFVFNKISDCLGSLTSPMRLQVIPSGANNVTIPPQVVYGSNSAQPTHCEPAFHNIAGGGTVTYTAPYTFIIQYTDLYEDSTGLQHLFVKTDTYIKAP